MKTFEVIDESFSFDATKILNVKMISGFPQQNHSMIFEVTDRKQEKTLESGICGTERVVRNPLTAGNESFVKLMTTLSVATSNDQ